MPEPAPLPAPPRSVPRGTDPLVGRAVSHYRVDERLGGGGMGVVYRAHDLTLGRDVALKFLPPSLHRDAAAREQLLQEARAASALDHAHVASVYEVGEADDGRLFLAMAYYDGQTVEELVDAGPLPVGQAVDVALQAGAGLARAHRAGIVHRDVKPGNLIVTADGVVKVLDFGIATAEGDGAGTGETAGSAPYMSPEQAQGRPTDARTDVWGLGVTLYEMLTGRAPFSGAFTTAVLYAVLHTDPRPVEELRPDLPAPLGAVVARCLAKDPADRYPSVDALLDDLRPVIAPPSAVPGGAGWIGGMLRKGRLRALLAVVVPLLGAATVWGLWPSGPTEQHLAVLPFTASGGDDAAEELADGLVETITGRLSQLEQFGNALWVIPASEVQPGMTLADARDQLGATLAVGGVVQVEDGRVRLLLTLSDAETQRQITTQQVDVDEGSALAIQDQAVLEIARMLEVEVDTQARDALVAGGTDDAEANALYLRGQGVLRESQSVADVEEAVTLLRRAVERDGSFALAHAALGQALWEAYEQSGDTELADDAAAAVEQALALDERSALVLVAAAAIYAGRQEVQLALDTIDRALDVDPTNAEAARLRASVYQSQGRTTEAEREFQRAVSLRPGHWREYNALGVFYYQSGRTDDAIAAYRRALRFAPSNLKVLSNLAVAIWETGEIDEAARLFERVLDIDPDHEWAGPNLATLLFFKGEYARAAELYAPEQARRPDEPSNSTFLGDALYWAPGQRGRAAPMYQAALRAAREQARVSRSPEVVLALASSHARLGAEDSARAYLAELAAVREPADVDVDLALGVGETYEILGDRDRAVVWVGSALERGYGAVPFTRSPWFEGLRQDPRLSVPPPQ